MTPASAAERLARWWRSRGRSIPGATAAWSVARRTSYATAGVLLRRGVGVHLASGDEIRVHPAFLGWNLEQYEPELVRWLANELRPGDHLIDVGAHVGFFSLLASSRVGSSGRVVAIEALPPTCALLRRHLAMNRARNVTAITALAGSREGAREIDVRKNATDPGACANSIAYRIPGGRTTRVAAVTLDRVVERLGLVPRVLKIDVEGAEFEVLRGAADLLRAHRPLIACAVHPEPLIALGESTSRLAEWLAGFGYRCSSLAGEAIEVPGEQNVLFVPGAR